MTTILTFFAHPDDETLAMGGTIKRLTDEGSTVHVAIPSTGVFSRRNVEDENLMNSKFKSLRANCFEALAVLGVCREHVHFGDFSDNEMDRHTLLELAQWLEGIMGKVKPGAMFTHHRFCTNIDHQYCHEAAVIATRPSVEQRIPLIAGEVPSSTGYLKPTCWEPNLYIPISAVELEAKITAMQIYSGEARPDPHPRSPEVLRAVAKVRGSEGGSSYAEAFMVKQAFGFAGLGDLCGSTDGAVEVREGA